MFTSSTSDRLTMSSATPWRTDIDNTALQATVAISVVDGIPLPAGEEFTGVIRSQDVRATEKDKVKIGDCFRGGDVVKGMVISLGDARSYYITTARNDLGVIFATSEAAVLSATDALRRDPIMASLDDNQINYSSTDWKAKYYEVADMLAETRAELDEFHTSSKELEEELIKEIERTEKAQQDLKVKISRMESERDEWKSKFMSLQTTHNTTTTSLQRELDTLRQECQKLKVQLRELEMGNDDLERNERAVSSSLADVEAKYSRALEEKILLEHELLDKAHLEEECQRLKDELRDAGVEISILKDQVSALRSRASVLTVETSASTAPSSSSSRIAPSFTEEENLLHSPLPPDLQLSELSALDKSTASSHPRPPSTSLSSTSGHSVSLQRSVFQSSKINPAHSTPTSVTRSTTLPTFSASRNSPRTPILRPNLTSSSATPTASAIPVTATKSRGVQMVSEMRARVKNLEQKIHTRVPRLRMGSNAGRQATNPFALSTIASASPSVPNSSAPKTAIPRSTPLESQINKPAAQRYSADAGVKKSGATTPDPNTSGWVLIMDDSPSPAKDQDKERRRVSSPSGPSAYHRGLPSASSPTFSKPNPLAQSTTRRPQSRLSGASMSTTATVSSIPTPSSRPTTPTFLPLPISSLYTNGHTPGTTFVKRSIGPGAGPYGQPKYTSLGSNVAESPTPSSDGEIMPRDHPASCNAEVASDTKALPLPPRPHSNVTLRGPSRIPSSTSSSVLGQSRIGRPAGVGIGRKSVGLDPHGEDHGTFLAPNGDKKNRGRSGSAFGFGR
ncbi:hypothetical protein ID866_587 [Astraeus odoratus]|nr:hypothetical protein ID866_587 [Astraeus odoratus]